MKNLVFFSLFLFGQSLLSNAQQVGLTQLKSFVKTASIQQTTLELSSKGWEFLKIDTLPNMQLTNFVWAYKRDSKKNEAVAWLTITLDNEQPIRVLYELFDVSLTTKMTANIVSSEFKYAAIDESEEEFTTRYDAAQYYLWEYMNKISEKGHQYELIRKYSKIDPYNGEKLTYFPSGILKSAVVMKDGKASGLARYYSENGQLIEEANWKNGVQEGLTIYYTDEGIKEKDVLFENGHLMGESHMYYPSGAVAGTCNYVYDQLSGKGTDFSEDGQITATYAYIGGVLFGKYEEFVDGQLSFHGNYTNGKLNGPFHEIIFGRDGTSIGSTTGCYWNDLLDGRCVAMYANKQDTMSVRTYQKGIPVGKWRYYSPDGNLDETKEFNQGYAVAQKLFDGNNLRGYLIQLPASDSTMRLFEYFSSNKESSITVHFAIPAKLFLSSKNEFATFYKLTDVQGESGIISANFKEGSYSLKQADLAYSGNYTNGMKQGEWTRYFYQKKVTSIQVFERGNLQRESFMKKNGKPFSGNITYVSNDSKIVIEVKNGKRNGKTTVFSSFGTIESETNYINGETISTN